MITNAGKDIIAKYLLSQVPSYASYIAIGCGPQPIASSGALGDYSTKTSLDFEMFRVPIVSRGYVTENGVSQIVFTAELPTEERYEISEIGVFSAKSNPLLSSNDSRILFKLNTYETWVNSDGNTNIPSSDSITNYIAANTKVFFGNSADQFYQSQANRTQIPRYLNQSIIVRGDYSTIGTDSSPHLKIAGLNLDLSQASPSDQISIAIAIANNTTSPTSKIPGKAQVKMVFKNSNGSASAIFETPTGGDYPTNRYRVLTKTIADFGTFDWKNITEVDLYIHVAGDSGTSSSPSDFYVAVDGIRYENKSSVNPLYSMTGYSVIKNLYGTTITKDPNTAGFIEFRFGMDVL